MTEFTSSKPVGATASATMNFAALALPIVTVAIFTAAALLFWVQPMFGKMVLPLLGGSSAVWTTAMLFFQTALLLGYLYAHALGTLLPLRSQIAVHVVVVVAAAFALPVAIPVDFAPPAEGAPVLWLVSLFTVAVGLPYTVVAATSPLLQRWFALSGHKSAADPYYLYVASNAGSLIGLLGYPLLVEPLVGVSAQSGFWTAGYLLLIALLAASGFAVWRLAPSTAGEAPRNQTVAKAPVSNFDRLRWVALAFVPSSLLLGVTTHITTDIASVPLLWAAPLALYLITFMIAFAQKPLIPRSIALKAESVALVMLTAFMWFSDLGIIGLFVHLTTFFVIAVARHGALADMRPDASRLTEFYLWLSVGGALGGAFNAIIAPMIFANVLEYPIALVAAAATRAMMPGALNTRLTGGDLVLPGVAAFTAAALWIAGVSVTDLPNYVILIAVIALAMAVYHVNPRPVRFALGVAAMFLLLLAARHDSRVTTEARSFFGTYRVINANEGKLVLFTHGTTLHGAQSTEPALRHVPLAYHSPEGPLGQAIRSLQAAHPRLRYALVGLGAGASACYARPSDTWVFYEIDPLVVSIARDSGAFSFMKDCAPNGRVVTGDGRLALALEPDGFFDVLILDAFSSDSVPMHLMTREALALARKKLAPGGVILSNISNRYLRLEPVMANSMNAAGLVGIAQFFKGQPRTTQKPASASHWVALAVNPADLTGIARSGRWRPLKADASAPLWTDDYSNLVGVISFKPRADLN
ncbi:MAG: fused MFS/spermidine synthase [Alphaproteobacteria bacterium]|nr:fused MFS/spermidine synthase [Alphaproteobacteria bacterium]